MKRKVMKYAHQSFLYSALFLCMSCANFLDVKPDQALAVPEKLDDFERLLDGFTVMNTTLPTTGAVFGDEYYVLPNDWKNLSNVQDRNFYIWQYPDEFKTVVNQQYRAILHTNMVFDGLKKVKIKTSLEDETSKRIKGSAYYHRGFRYYVVALIHAPHPKHPDADRVRVPLRLTSDNSSPSKLVPTSRIYKQIVDDLKSSIQYLPERPSIVSRPSKAAAYGLLAKVLLDMGNYQEALQYADSSLMIKRDLINLNQINLNAAAPFERFNKEVIFHARSATATILARNISRIDTTLFSSYAANDLRIKAFYVQGVGGKVEFKGDYDGRGTASGYDFWGVTVPDVILIKSECLARIGQYEKAHQELWGLLKNRLVVNAENPVPIDQKVLPYILKERRKELVRKAARWMDIRRLMHDPDHSVDLRRIIDGQVYRPNPDQLYIPIPASILIYGEEG